MDLHKEFIRLGKMRNKLTHELQALIPEIFRLRIWEKEGFQSIYHYAAVLAGLSPGVVDKVLRVEKSLEDKPHLKEIIKSEGIHKVAMIAQIATPENEQEMARIVKNCSKRALEQYSKEIRGKKEKLKIELDDEMQQMFFKLKKKYGDKLSNKEVLRRIFEELSEENLKSEKIPGEKIEGRYIPVSTKRYILTKYKHKCAYPGCNKAVDVLHHRERFTNRKSHKSLVPLCKTHHEFAHNGLIKHELKPPPNWQLGHKVRHEASDALWQKYRETV